VAEIALHRVTKRFAGVTALKAASVTIGDGELFILVGPSGCGKSTLLNMIVGLEDVTEGEIRLDGELINDLDPKDRNMAMVFQSYAIYPHMTVRENLAFPLRLAGFSKDAIEDRVKKAAEILELHEVLDRKPRALSGGQRQRVAMGRAIVRKPKVFLLDEPLSNLDAKLRVQMRTEILRLQRRLKTTMVYVTHDQTEAMTLGHRIAVLRKGEVLQIGTPRELYQRPANLFVAGFIGSPAMNFVPARWARGKLELPLGAIELSEAQAKRVHAAKGPLVAGFRPEHLRIGNDEPGSLDFGAEAEVVEWLGADLLVYFDVPLQGFEEVELPEDLSLRRGEVGRRSLLARIGPTSGVSEGQRFNLRLDPRHLQIFEAESGENLLWTPK
jgi:multiple sugar transport system ATP-binding protein